MFFFDTSTPLAHLKNPLFSRNKILTQNVCIDLNTSPSTLVLSSEEYRRDMVHANLLQAEANFIVPDADGYLYAQTGDFLRQQGYNVQVLNLASPSQSASYNPLIYVHTERDIENIVTILMRQGLLRCSEKDYSYTTSLLATVIGYAVSQCPKQRNLSYVYELVQQLVDGADVTPIVQKAETLHGYVEQCAQQVRNFDANELHMYANNASIVLHLLNIPEVSSLLSENQINLTIFDQPKQALFIVYKPVDDSLHFVMQILYTQLGRILLAQMKWFCSERNMFFVPEHTYTQDHVLDELMDNGVDVTLLYSNMSQVLVDYQHTLDKHFASFVIKTPIQDASTSILVANQEHKYLKSDRRAMKAFKRAQNGRTEPIQHRFTKNHIVLVAFNPIYEDDAYNPHMHPNCVTKEDI